MDTQAMFFYTTSLATKKNQVVNISGLYFCYNIESRKCDGQ